MLVIDETDNQQTKVNPVVTLDKRVWAVYCDLQSAVDNMDRKVELVMQKHESQFLYAYRTHIHKIKKELQDIKKKSEEQQRLFSSNDRIRYLEKQVAVFRQEAIELYETIQKKSLEIQILKKKTEEAEIISKKLQIQNKEVSLELKRLSSNQVDFMRKIQQLENKLKQQRQRKQKIEQKLVKERSRRDFMESTREKASSLAKSRDFSPRQFKTYNNQLQEWFLECVKSVKRQIQQRKNSFDSIDLKRITNINEFRLVDKLRLFELLLENEKLLNWLYHKIFPDRFDKIGQYLSNTQSMPATDTDLKSEAVKSERYLQVQQNFQLPKVSTRKNPSSLRNQIIIKNGKMNISAV